ncbi:MAG: DUF4249 family protein [Bacteroidetes bacterium]|nr:MAG: DUF4249 family protein [Bacteroidota bacterium]
MKTKKMNKRLISPFTCFWACLLLAVMQQGCVPEPVEIDIEQAEPRLVVASQMLFQEGVLVHVSKSFGALDFSQEAGDSLTDAFLEQVLVPHARVTLTYKDGTDTLLGIGQGFYLSLSTPMYPHEPYLLEVYDSVSGQQVMARTEVLPPTRWAELDYAFDTTSLQLADTTFRDTLLQLYAAFEDLPGESYYMLNVYRLSGGERQTYDLLQLQSGSAVHLYADQLYAGASQIRDTLSYPGFRPGDTVAFAISHISRGYYDFQSARQRSGSSLFVNLLQEPVNYPTNVVGGYGYFNLHGPAIEVKVLE